MAESELISQSDTDAEVRWRDGFTLETLKGDGVRLRFDLRNAKLYSFSFLR